MFAFFAILNINYLLEKKLESKNHENLFSRHQAPLSLMTGIDFDFNTYCKGDYLANRENNQNFLTRVGSTNRWNRTRINFCKPHPRGEQC